MKRSLVAMAAAALVLAGIAAAQKVAEGNAENGKRLFLRDGCWECHGYAGQGSRDGARIANTALNAPGFIRYVRRPSGSMPAFVEKVATDQELTDIWAYLKSMPASKSAKDIPLLNQIKNHQ
jgi:mono/diheme cytochrome c family protein